MARLGRRQPFRPLLRKALGPASAPVSGSQGLTVTVTGSATLARPVAGSCALTFTATGSSAGLLGVAGTSSLTFTAAGSTHGLLGVAGTSSLVFTATGSTHGLLGVAGSCALILDATGATGRLIPVAGSCLLVLDATGSEARALGGGAGSCALTFHVAGGAVVRRNLAVAGSCLLRFRARGRLKVPEAVVGDTYLGRLQVGREWPLAMLARDRRGAPAVPAEAPTATVYDLATRARVADVTIPHPRGARAASWFAGPWRPDVPLAPGRYGIVVRSTAGGFTSLDVALVEVDAGGDPAGPVVAAAMAETPAAAAALARVAAGALLVGRKPRPGGP